MLLFMVKAITAQVEEAQEKKQLEERAEKEGGARGGAPRLAGNENRCRDSMKKTYLSKNKKEVGYLYHLTVTF